MDPISSSIANSKDLSISFFRQHPGLVIIPAILAISTLATLIALKLGQRYNSSGINELKIETTELHNRYPYLTIIASLFTVAASLISLNLGIPCAIALGFYAGCRFEFVQNIRWHNALSSNELQALPPANNQIVT